jgi:LL-diaminopimelate aminotransferase
MEFRRAQRLDQLPPYLFAELDRRRKAAIANGVDIISLGIGDPDLPTPSFIIDALHEAARDPRNHQYPLGAGLPEFRAAVADWYRRRFGVELDPASEVVALIGSKEGIGHLPLGVLNPGDVALVPSPGYPVYNAGTVFAGAEPFFLPLREENGFRPDLDAIPEDVLKRARLLWINSPNNPTSAVMGKATFSHVVDFANENGLIVAHDAAYSEVYFDGKRPPSFLEAPGARQLGVEFHSLSKTFNMTGWRVGFAVGNRDILASLATVKENMDSGQFNAIQRAGVAALSAPDTVTDDIRRIYQERRDFLFPELKRMGFGFEIPEASFYFWVKVPKGEGSLAFCTRLLEQAGVVVTPGVGFGDAGEGYFRIAMTVDLPRLREALARIASVL